MNARSVSGGWGCRAPRRGVGRVLGALLGVAVGSVGGLGTVTAAGVGVAVLAGTAMTTTTASALTPDPVFGGTLTAAQQAEMMQWGQTYWNRLEGVPTAANTTFTFSTTAMNSPLFNPFYGPRQTLVNLGLIADGDCMKQLAEYPGTDAASAAKRQAIKDALVNFKFKTDPVTDPTGTTTHVIKILDASTVAGLVTYTEDGKLVSEKLPLDIIVAAGADPQLAGAISADTINAINAIVVTAPGFAANQSGLTEAQKLLSGGVGRADQVRTSIKQVLVSLGKGDAPVERFDMLFGVYGSLPLVVVGFEDCKIVVDAVNGSVHPPIAHGSTFDSTTLLQQHGVPASGGVVLVSAQGCIAATGPNVPPLTFPRPPALPCTPQAPATPTAAPGNPTAWACTNVTMAGGSSCVCTRTYMYDNPGPPLVAFPVVQSCAAAGFCTATAVPLPGSTCQYTY